MDKSVETKIVDLFINNIVSCSEIADMLNISVYDVNHVLVKYDLYRKRLPDDKLLELYSSGISLCKIEKEFKYSRQSLSIRLKKLGIKVINKQNVVIINENVFDEIDSEEKAYWLGFLYADGCVRIQESFRNNCLHKSYTLEISLKAADYQHLIKFNSFTEAKYNKVYITNTNYKNHKRCRWTICNKHMVSTLISKGCTPNKSLMLKFPNVNIFSDSSLIKHFIRGYFDGDGCLSFRKNKNSVVPVVSILGTLDFLNGLVHNAKINRYNLRKDKRHLHDTYTLDIYSTYDFLDYIYKNSTIYLNRKYNRYLFFKSDCRSSKELEELLASEVGEGWDANTELTKEFKKSLVV